jgi:hypothetical protein
LWALLILRVRVRYFLVSTGDWHSCLCLLSVHAFHEISRWIFDPSSFPLQIPKRVRVCASSFVSDLCRYDRLVISQSHNGAICALRFHFFAYATFVKGKFPFWIVGASPFARDIPSVPRFHWSPAFLPLPPFRACVHAIPRWIFESFFPPLQIP